MKRNICKYRDFGSCRWEWNCEAGNSSKFNRWCYLFKVFSYINRENADQMKIEHVEDQIYILLFEKSFYSKKNLERE